MTAVLPPLTAPSPVQSPAQIPSIIQKFLDRYILFTEMKGNDCSHLYGLLDSYSEYNVTITISTSS